VQAGPGLEGEGAGILIGIALPAGRGDAAVAVEGGDVEAAGEEHGIELDPGVMEAWGVDGVEGAAGGGRGRDAIEEGAIGLAGVAGVGIPVEMLDEDEEEEGGEGGTEAGLLESGAEEGGEDDDDGEIEDEVDALGDADAGGSWDEVVDKAPGVEAGAGGGGEGEEGGELGEGGDVCAVEEGARR